MEKKILIFSLSYYPKPVGGAEVAIKEITDRLGEEEYEWHLICNRYDSLVPKTEKVGVIHVHRIGLTKAGAMEADFRKMPLHLNKLIYQFLAYFKAKQLHREYQFDGVWAMMAHSCGVPAGMFKKKFPGVQYVLTLQEGDPPEEIEAKMKPFGKKFVEAFTRADIVQSISNFLAAWARTMGYTGPAPVIPNAVHTKHFMQTYSQEQLYAAAQQLDKRSDSVFLVTTSRLVHKNGIDTVIEALPLMPREVEFVIYGKGPEEVSLRQRAIELGVEERVHFNGYVEHSEMPLYLKACDIFIRPSRSEGMGNSFVEAMAAEVPVIATQEGGIADFLFDANRNPEQEATGWAVDADAPEQIAEAVDCILQNTQQTEQTLKTAKEMVVTKYDWDDIAVRMHKEVFLILNTGHE